MIYVQVIHVDNISTETTDISQTSSNTRRFMFSDSDFSSPRVPTTATSGAKQLFLHAVAATFAPTSFCVRAVVNDTGCLPAAQQFSAATAMAKQFLQTTTATFCSVASALSLQKQSGRHRGQLTGHRHRTVNSHTFRGIFKRVGEGGREDGLSGLYNSRLSKLKKKCYVSIYKT